MGYMKILRFQHINLVGFTDSVCAHSIERKMPKASNSLFQFTIIFTSLHLFDSTLLFYFVNRKFACLHVLGFLLLSLENWSIKMGECASAHFHRKFDFLFMEVPLCIDIHQYHFAFI